MLCAKDSAPAVQWPDDHPVLRFQMVKCFRESEYKNRSVFNIELVVKNVSSTTVSSASFHLYLLDKSKVRVSDNWISINALHAGETVKRVVTAQALGSPSDFTVAPDELGQELAYLAPAKLISTTIDSIPSGAKVSADGKPLGVTPVEVGLAVGAHSLTFEKAGFATGTYPLKVAPDQVSGGRVTFELNGAQFDMVELRDGSMVTGRLQRIDDTEVVLETSAGLQKYARNAVKRVSLVQRPAPASPAN